MSADDAPTLPPGTRFGRYRIESLLGAGAMGAVYTATHIGLDKRVVVKVLRPEHARSSNIRMRFFREGKAASAIRHPHVVDVTDVGEHEGIPFLVMEHLDGQTLGDLIAREGALPTGRAVDLMLPVIDAVDAAHAAGVVHRDLKPDNLFVARSATGDEFPKVLDFGISRLVSDGGRRTGTAALLGTPAYIAPEQIESTRDADARSDQYALGVILYECLTGVAAFPGEHVYQILKQVGDGAFQPPRVHRPDLPAPLESIVLRAMARDPARRFSSLREMARALLPFATPRARASWTPTLAPVADAAPPTDLAHVSRSAVTQVAHPDTLVDAVRSHDTTLPRGRSPSRIRGAVVLALLGLALVGVVAAVALRPRAAEAPVASTTPQATAPAVTTQTPTPPSPVVAAPVLARDVPAVAVDATSVAVRPAPPRPVAQRPRPRATTPRPAAHGGIPELPP